MKIKKTTKYSPKPKSDKIRLPKCSKVDDCSNAGYCTSKDTCSCYAGSIGKSCAQIACTNNCSGNGKCVGPNTCECRAPYTGPSCAVLSVTAKYETEASGADGDDPAIWITAENDKTKSRIVTTTKSEADPGLSVFDLRGKKLQFISAPEPNNVDVIYNFPLGNGKIDLAYAGCRGNNTLW